MGPYSWEDWQTMKMFRESLQMMQNTDPVMYARVIHKEKNWLKDLIHKVA